MKTKLSDVPGIRPQGSPRPSPRKEILGDDKAFLRLKRPPAAIAKASPEKVLTVADFFCGAGGLSLGLHLAARELGASIETRLAVDLDAAAVACYARNFPGANVIRASVERMLEPDLEAPLSAAEKRLRTEVGHLDILAGGPPCQGHSDLNNFTRRDDPKNQLYLYMARAALVLRPRAIIIENVVGSLHDKKGVVQKVVRRLAESGYHVDCDFLDFLAIGVPQKRRRLVITASLAAPAKIADIQRRFALPHRTLEWAIGDLEDASPSSLMNTPSKPAAATRKRIDYLFKRDLHELPNSQRPPCHRDKKHSYESVYGRLRWHSPTQTITSGFYSMCMGRYVHPSRPRTLTAQEAARAQFFPDYYDFSPAKNRTKIAELIGNAVPPKGGYALGLSLIGSLLSADVGVAA